jgi:transposase
MRPFTLAWLKWLGTSSALSPEGRWVITQHLRWIELYNQELRHIEDRLSEKTQTDPVVRSLCKQAGIGLVTAWTIRAEVGRFDRFRNSKQLARFCGLCPRNASSGARQADAGLVKAANSQLRATLIEAAQSLIQYNAYWRALAKRLREVQGKPYNVAVAAVANRWIRRLFHAMRTIQEAA